MEQLGVDVNQTSNTGFSAFFKAIQKNDIAVARYLHQKGADVNLAEKNGFTPTFWAAQEGKIELLELLVEGFGADLNQASSIGEMPVQAARKNGQTRAVKKCVRMGCRMASSLLVEQKCGCGCECEYECECGCGCGVVRLVPEERKLLVSWLQAHVCAVPGCPKSATKKCVDCKQVRYCSKACQKADWPRHKLQC